MKRLGRREGGFTLIELLVVVGIMAALAAILVPNVARFVGTGQQEGAAAELDAIQAAVDAAIADNGWTTVTVGDEVEDFSSVGLWSPGNDAGGVAVYLYPNYLRIDIAKYPAAAGAGYDIDATGRVLID